MTVLIKCLSSTYLEHINLTGCSVSDEQACLLFAAVRNRPPKFLSATSDTHTHTRTHATTHITRHTHTHTTHNTQHTHTHDTPQLAENQTVGSLNLSHNHISRPSVEHIAQFLYVCLSPFPHNPDTASL
jgi:hypothetical protein